MTEPMGSLLTMEEADAAEAANAAVQEPAIESDGLYDAEAPYGRNPRTGKPFRQSPEERAAFGARMAQARREATSRGGSVKAPPAKKTSAKSSSAKAPPKIDPVKMGADTLISTASLVTMALGRFGLGQAFAYDSLAIQLHGPNISDALVQAADQMPRLEAWLEGIGSMGGPWAIVAMAVAPLVGQLAANHRLIRPGMLGSMTTDQLHKTVAPETYAAMVKAREEAEAAAAQAMHPPAWQEEIDDANANAA